MDRIGFSFNEDFGDEVQGHVDSLAKTVKRVPYMADQSTARPGATGKLASLVATAQAKRVHLGSPESHQQPGATGRLASLFASAHGKCVQLGPQEPEQPDH